MRIDTRTAVVEKPHPSEIRHAGGGFPVVPAPPKWEYRSCLMDRDSDLSQYGSEGWECYSVVDAGADKATFYFKRVKR